MLRKIINRKKMNKNSISTFTEQEIQYYLNISQLIEAFEEFSNHESMSTNRLRMRITAADRSLLTHR